MLSKVKYIKLKSLIIFLNQTSCLIHLTKPIWNEWIFKIDNHIIFFLTKIKKNYLYLIVIIKIGRNHWTPMNVQDFLEKHSRYVYHFILSVRHLHKADNLKIKAIVNNTCIGIIIQESGHLLVTFIDYNIIICFAFYRNPKDQKESLSINKLHCRAFLENTACFNW